MTTSLKNTAYDLVFKNIFTNHFGYSKPESAGKHLWNLSISTLACGSICLVGHAIAVFATGSAFFAFSIKHAISILSALVLTAAGMYSSKGQDITGAIMFVVAIPATYGWGLVTLVTRSSFSAFSVGKIAGAIALPVIAIYATMDSDEKTSFSCKGEHGKGWSCLSLKVSGNSISR